MPTLPPSAPVFGPEDFDGHRIVMDDLASRHELISGLIGARSVHYVDLPFHGNLGDLLIMLGTFRFFERFGVRLDLASFYFNYRSNWLHKDAVLLLHGGGNLGDVWEEYQESRERLIASVPDNRVIILPQSIYFKSESSRLRCKQAFGSHKDLHLCVRDEKSRQLAEGLCANVYLLPDMAHQLWPTTGVSRPELEVMLMHRTDREKAELPPDLQGMPSVDWGSAVPNVHLLMKSTVRMLKLLHVLHADRMLVSPVSQIWRRIAQRWAVRANGLFSRYRYVITDRLHGHILSCLLGVPNCVYDNNYGKNSTYVQCWTGRSPIVQLRPSATDS